MITHRSFYLFFVFLLSLGMISCTKKKTVNDRFPREETLWVNWGTEPPTLDWNLANDLVSGNILFNLMEPLVGLNLQSKDLEPTPGLFTQWTPNNEFTKWTFTLASGVKWTDGTPLSMQHVTDSFRRLLDPKNGAEGASFIYPVKNAEEFHKGTLNDFGKVGIKVNENNQLEFLLERPIVFFPKVLTSVNTMPIRKDLIEKHGAAWTEPQNLVTLGAYKLFEWKHDELIVLKTNPTYFGSKPQIPIIAGRMINDLTAAAELFEAERLDIHRGLTPNDEKRFEKKSEFKKQPSLAVLYFNFNTRTPPLNSKNVRKLIVQSINRKELVSVLGGYRRLNTGWLPSGLLGSIEDQGLAFDTKSALGIFQTLNNQQRHQLQALEIESNSNETHKIMLENIQGQLKKNLGIKLKTNMEEWKTYLRKVRSFPAPIFRMGFVSLYPDPHFLMSIWKSNSYFNMTGWASKEYDQLVDQAASEMNPQKRIELYEAAQKILIDDAPFFTVYSATNLSLVSKRVKNYISNPVERLIFKDMKL